MNAKSSEAARQVEKRKEEHIKIQLENNIEFHTTNLLENVFLTHNSLPELDRNQINSSTKFLNHNFKAPLMIAAITGGAKIAEKINKNIAKSCQNLGIGMGFGSMKAMILNPELTYSYQVRDVAPDIFIAGNIGANDLKYFSPKLLKETLKVIGADILAVHLNPAQELIQKEGQSSYKGVLELIQKYSELLPIYVKETGQGISYDVAKTLSRTNIKALDTGGSGGTSWTGIEYVRKGQSNGLFWDWGIPTALSIIEIRKATSIPLIATGGIRNGQEVVKSIVLGADLSAMALPVLKNAVNSYETTQQALFQIITEIEDTMYLLGVKDIKGLKKIKPRLTGLLRELVD